MDSSFKTLPMVVILNRLKSSSRIGGDVCSLIVIDNANLGIF